MEVLKHLAMIANIKGQCAAARASQRNSELTCDDAPSRAQLRRSGADSVSGFGYCGSPYTAARRILAMSLIIVSL
jgi:hypothetical protein